MQLELGLNLLLSQVKLRFGLIGDFYILGVIYDVIVEPPGVGSTTDERGISRPVRIGFNAWKIIMYSKDS